MKILLKDWNNNHLGIHESKAAEKEQQGKGRDNR